MRCAVCGLRVRTITRLNSDKAVITPVRHKANGVRCNGWLTPALEEPQEHD